MTTGCPFLAVGNFCRIFGLLCLLFLPLEGRQSPVLAVHTWRSSEPTPLSLCTFGTAMSPLKPTRQGAGWHCLTGQPAFVLEYPGVILDTISTCSAANMLCSL